MNISLHLSITTVWLPITVTLVSILVFAVVVWIESREGGDYSIPVFSFMTFCVGLGATAIAWLVYFLGNFLK